MVFLKMKNKNDISSVAISCDIAEQVLSSSDIFIFNNNNNEWHKWVAQIYWCSETSDPAAE